MAVPLPPGVYLFIFLDFYATCKHAPSVVPDRVFILNVTNIFDRSSTPWGADINILLLFHVITEDQAFSEKRGTFPNKVPNDS